MTAQDRLCRQLMLGSEPIPYAPEIINAMRAWVADCVWRDLVAEDVESLSEAEILDGVKNHYDGGIEAFLKTCQTN